MFQYNLSRWKPVFKRIVASHSLEARDIFVISYYSGIGIIQGGCCISIVFRISRSIRCILEDTGEHTGTSRLAPANVARGAFEDCGGTHDQGEALPECYPRISTRLNTAYENVIDAIEVAMELHVPFHRSSWDISRVFDTLCRPAKISCWIRTGTPVELAEYLAGY